MDPLRFPARHLQLAILICLCLVTLVNYFLHTTKKVSWPDFPLLQLGSSVGGGEYETWRMGGHHVNVNGTDSNSTISAASNESGPGVVIMAFSAKATVYSVIGTGLLNATVTAIRHEKRLELRDAFDRNSVYQSSRTKIGRRLELLSGVSIEAIIHFTHLGAVASI